MSDQRKPAVIPMLFIPHGTTDIDFYKNAFGAEILRVFKDSDNSIHVAELTINGVIMFRLHEENADKGQFAPYKIKGITTNIGIKVDDVDAVMAGAVAAGATITNPAQDYDYGYRQGDILDPFGHTWTIESGDIPSGNEQVTVNF